MLVWLRFGIFFLFFLNLLYCCCFHVLVQLRDSIVEGCTCVSGGTAGISTRTAPYNTPTPKNPGTKAATLKSDEERQGERGEKDRRKKRESKIVGDTVLCRADEDCVLVEPEAPAAWPWPWFSMDTRGFDGSLESRQTDFTVPRPVALPFPSNSTSLPPPYSRRL